MTKRELIRAQIRAEKIWLRMLTDSRYSDKDLGLPKQISRRQAVDDSLDRINNYRKQLIQTDHE